VCFRSGPRALTGAAALATIENELEQLGWSIKL
jgi:hypothetical protein